MFRQLGLLAAVTIVLGGSILLPSLSRTPRAAQDLPQSLYVWQRQWGDPVRAGLLQASEVADTLIVLAAEIAWERGEFKVARVSPDFASLAKTGRPIGLAIRIGTYQGEFSSSDATASSIITLVQEIVQEAADAGCYPAEVQIDFDCATSKLAGYRLWVEAVSAALPTTPIAITALPTWMTSRDFGPLSKAAGHFVLQVHSLERPKAGDAYLTLCKTSSAKDWVEQAAKFGVPFRVALPTYGYFAAFDSAGKLLGVIAESEAPEWVDGAAMRELRADPAEMADLVRTWSTDRPALMESLIWYRMPIDADRLNWSWPTLRRVMTGTAPEPRLVMRVRHEQPGLFEIIAKNEGDADAVMPERVTVAFPAGSLVASDALAGLTIETSRPGAAMLVRPSSPLADRVRPGEERLLAWFRFVRDVEVTTDVPLKAR